MEFWLLFGLGFLFAFEESFKLLEIFDLCFLLAECLSLFLLFLWLFLEFLECALLFLFLLSLGSLEWDLFLLLVLPLSLDFLECILLFLDFYFRWSTAWTSCTIKYSVFKYINYCFYKFRVYTIFFMMNYYLFWGISY